MSWRPASYAARAASGPCVLVTATIVTCCPCPPRAVAAAILARTSATRSARPGKAIACKFSRAGVAVQLSDGSCAGRMLLLHPPLVTSESLENVLVVPTFDAHRHGASIGASCHA